MTDMIQKPLKIFADDQESLTIVSTFLQDALLPLTGIHYEEKDKRISLLFNRFRWENTTSATTAETHERIHTGVAFSNVDKVEYIGLEPHHKSSALNLLAIRHEKNYVNLIFSGKAEIRLNTKKLSVHVKDMSEAWPVSKKPSHPLD
jgi:hypothetical protein